MNFYRTLFMVALPIILQNFLTSFVNMLDTVMVGQLGAVEIAAVGLGNQIFFIMNTALFGVVSGGSIFIAQFWGKRDIPALRQVMGITVTLSACVALLFAAAAGFFPEACLSMYTKDAAVIAMGAEYLRTVAASYLLIGIGFAFAHAERSTGHVRLPMAATAVSVGINALCNMLLIFGLSIQGTAVIPAMGVRGAALATVISRFVECSILVGAPVFRRYEIIGKFHDYILTNPRFLVKYAAICLPVLVNETLWGFGISMQNSIFAHIGTDVVAAFHIRGTIDNLVWVFCIGTGNAAAIIIGRKIGEAQYDEARSFARRMCVFMALCGAGLALLVVPLSMLLPLFFHVSPQILQMAARMLYLTALFYPFCAFNMCMIVGVCRSGGDTLCATLMDVGCMWLVSLPAGAVAAQWLHAPYWAVYLCIGSENILKAAAGLLRLRSGRWLHNVTE